MIGKWRFCTLIAFIGFLITFAVSSGHNLFMTSLVRSLIAFVIWFALSYAATWIFDFLKELPSNASDSLEQYVHSDEGKGGNLDLTTPDESNEIHDLLRQPTSDVEEDTSFAPLNPPKLVKTDDRSTEEIVKVVRHLTEE